jgi:hypothetical protein
MRMVHSARRTVRNVRSPSTSSAHTSMGVYLGVEEKVVPLTEVFAVMDGCAEL